MKSARQIELDYTNARNQANELENIANRLRNLANRNLNEIVQNLPSYWDGPSAKMFQNKTSTLQQNLIRTARSLTQEANNIRNIARRIYQADMEALELARRREREAMAALLGGLGGGGR